MPLIAVVADRPGVMFTRKIEPQVEWVPLRSTVEPKPAPDRGLLGALVARLRVGIGLDAPIVAGARSRSLAEALHDVGVPRIAGTPESELVELLRFGAEVEHGLMAQYLYAMYSSKKPSILGVFKRIAVEEMGHLLTVQNLLLAGGQDIWLGRYDWRHSPSPFAPFPFRLEPVSQLSIAKYTACEMPDIKSPDINEAQKKLLPDILADAEESVGGTAPDNDPVRIGLLYMKVYWLLRKNDLVLQDPTKEPWPDFPVEKFAADPTLAGRHVADAFFHHTESHQGQTDQWRVDQENVIVRVIAGRCDALAAVAAITEQGEGFGTTPDGHFDAFVDLYRLAKDQVGLARLVPTDPWYGAGDANGRDPINKITSADGEKFARLGDRLYELILLSITLYSALPEEVDPQQRAGVAAAAIALMMGCLKQVGLGIVETERQAPPQDPSLVAHLCFSKPDDLVDATPQSILGRILSLLADSVAIAENIVATTAVNLRKSKAKAVLKSIGDDIQPAFDQIEL